MIKIKQISFSYRSRQKLLDHLDLNLESGSVYGLLGKNGVGKTTLLKLIAGLLYPLAGECSVLEQHPVKRHPSFLQELFFIPEEFYLPHISIEKYKKFYAPFYKRFDYSLFKTMLDEFDLDPKADLHTLSYGQKKKFLLAYGLASNTKLLLLDEPSNGLDIPSKMQFQRLIAAQLTEERTIIISTHQVRDLENLIDNIVILDDGEIAFNQSMHIIGQKLSFKRYHLGDIAPGESIYRSKSPGGNIVISKNLDREDSRIDLEALFNAVIDNRSDMVAAFEE
ncbi:MAG: ABC transporter ATP-binding protein [Gammaproteobacteria bacterium]|nr:ABC transporter ATP-binding protein [Gammaproteobacteria bacterium]